MDWRSDASIAYAIFRFTFGVNIAFRGIVRIANGLDVFAGDLVKQFAATAFPVGAVDAFGHVVPWVETIVGILLILGLWTRGALIIGGLMMASLTFGAMFLQNFNLAWLQLTYAMAFFALLALRSWNLISLDARLRSTSETPQAKGGAGLSRP